MQCGLTAASEFRVQVPLFVAVTGISLLGSAILIPRMGLIGAAMAALISSTVQLCASTALVFRAMGKRSRDLTKLKCSQLTPAL
jgi:O-antigen/teichoic acid export membrane protein